MKVNKIILNDQVLMDLSEDTVTPETVSEGITFHGSDGELHTGTRPPPPDVYMGEYEEVI